MDGQADRTIERKPEFAPVRPATTFNAVTGSSINTLEQVVDGPGAPSGFEAVYRSAAGDTSRIPWAAQKPCSMLVSWLNAEAAGRVRPGSRAIVVGCGLGDDVIELLNRGYDAIGFDVAPTAIEWARKRFPEHADAFCVGDLLNLPTRYRNRFELVVECRTIQSLHPVYREPAAKAIGNLCGPRGLVITIARGRDENELLEQVPSPPWPLTKGELLGLMELAGLKPLRAIDDFFDDQDPPKRRLRAIFERA